MSRFCGNSASISFIHLSTKNNSRDKSFWQSILLWKNQSEHETPARIERQIIESQGTFPSSLPYPVAEDVMKAYLSNLSTKTWMLLVLPAVALAYPIATIVVPAVIRAVVPQVVRSVLSVI